MERGGHGLVLVISGPSGVGKDTVWRASQPYLPTFERAVTCTTRPSRPGEVEGESYYFVDDAGFDRLIRDNELVEWAVVNGNRYGVPHWSIFNRINAGFDVVCVIDVQGALHIRRLFPQALLVFITPPRGRETQTLQERIVGRSTVDEAELQLRLQTANWELEHVNLYDYQIENHDVERAARELCEVVQRERTQRQSS